MSMRDKIADSLVNVLEHYRSADDIEYHAADAIIAALPNMIPDLVWTLRQVMGCDGLVSEDYSVHLGMWRYKDTPMSKGYGGLKEEAQAAANAHHRAAIMSAFKGEET
jgi:hypothetical protein